MGEQGVRKWGRGGRGYLGVPPLPCSSTPNLGHIWGNFQGRKSILGDNWRCNPLSRGWGKKGVGESMDKFGSGRGGVMHTLPSNQLAVA